MRYAAIGDSFTEGVGDQTLGGRPRGWADLVAAGLAADLPEPVWYANFAIRGRLLEPIVTDQLEAALRLSPAPTILTLNGGGNDMLRPGADLARLTALTAHAIDRCLDAGVRPVLLSGADPSKQLPFGRTFRRRGIELTEAAAKLAAAKDVLFVDVFGDEEIRDARYWSHDRLHLNPAGHYRVASLVLAALGSTPSAPPSAAEAPTRRGLLSEVRYYRDHVLPWVGRRIRGRSSGDGRSGKHLEWTLVEAG